MATITYSGQEIIWGEKAKSTEIKVQNNEKKFRDGGYYKEATTEETVIFRNRTILTRSIVNALVKIQEEAGGYENAKIMGLKYLEGVFPERKFKELPTVVLFPDEGDEQQEKYTSHLGSGDYSNFFHSV